MQITEQKLKENILRMVAERYLKENSLGMKNLLATRLLTIRAREAAFDFEKIIVKELGLLNPDEMDSLSQKVYVEAVETMQKRILDAVIDTIKSLSHLPKEQEEIKSDESAKTDVNLNVT